VRDPAPKAEAEWYALAEEYLEIARDYAVRAPLPTSSAGPPPDWPD
jgi:hypothetical protein